jgi:hypothetical protein
VKQENKAKLAGVVKDIFGDDVPLNALFDIQVRHAVETTNTLTEYHNAMKFCFHV